MKRLNFASLGLVCLFFLVTPFLATGQGADAEKTVIYLGLKLDNGEIFDLWGEGTMVLTPSNNFLKTYKYKVPDDVLAQIDFGIFANKIIGAWIEFDTGEILIGYGFLNKAGYLTFTIHKNGSGGFFPKGW